MRLRFANCDLDTDRQSLTRDGAPVAVEPQVFSLIRLLAENSERVVTRDEIVEAVWGGRAVSESAISARIASARKAVGDDGQRQAVIRTVQKRGLQLAVPAEASGEASGPAPARPPLVRYTTNEAGEALAYAISGSGPPVVRCAFTTHLEAEWSAPHMRAYRDAICSGNSLLRFDQVGSGMSQHGRERVDFDAHAEDLRCVTDAAGLDRFTLYSLSGAVHIALRFAARFPERVERLCIIGGYVTGRDIRSPERPPDFLRSMIAENWQDREAGLSRAMGMTYYPEGPVDVVAGYLDVMRTSQETAEMLAVRNAINTADSSAVLSRIACPTLIVHGRFDGVHPVAEAQKLAAGIRDAELLTLETANHVPLPGHPTWPTFVQAFRDFLDHRR